MQEIDEGLWYWTAIHPKIGWQVSSYYLSGERVLIDPVLPPGGRMKRRHTGNTAVA